MPSIPKLPLPLGYPEWIVIGLIFLLLTWLMGLIALVSHVAAEKGRSGWTWGCAAAVFSPPIALLALAALPNVEEEDQDEEDQPDAADVTEFKWRRGAG